MFIFNQNSLAKKILAYIVYALIISFPFVVYSGFLYGGSATRSLNITLLAIIAGIVLSVGILRKQITFKWIFSPITVILSVYLLILILSALFGVDPLVSFWSKATRTTGVYFMTHLALLYILLVSLFDEEKIRSNALSVFVYSSALFSFLSFLGPQGLGLLFHGYVQDGFTFQNSSFAAMHLLAAILFLLYKTKLSGWNWKRAALLVLLVVNPFFISKNVWTGSVHSINGVIGEAKASTIALVAALGFYVIAILMGRITSARIRKISAIGIVAVSIVGLGFVSGSLISNNGVVRQWYLKESSAIRPIVWDLSKKSIQDRPLLGWGTDNFDRAYEKHFDVRVLEAQYGNEAWLDRAHTPLIDQTVDNGYIGVVVYVAIFLTLILTALYLMVQSRKKEVVFLAGLTGVYGILHFLELQTAFDTSISALSFAMMLALSTIAYGMYRIDECGKEPHIFPSWTSILLAIVMIGYFAWSFFFGFIPFVRAQIANRDIRSVGSSEKRLPYYNRLFASPLDLPTFLWRTSTDLQRGIAENPSVLGNEKYITGFVQELDIMTDRYRVYLTKHPNDFRSNLNIADLLLYYSLLGGDYIDEARTYIAHAKELIPQNPMPYWMEAVSYVYQGKFTDARKSISVAETLGSDVVGTNEVKVYIDESQKSFPEINMYFFKQI